MFIKRDIAFNNALETNDIHEYVQLFEWHAFMKFKRKSIQENSLYVFRFRNKLETSMLKRRNMKTDEKKITRKY